MHTKNSNALMRLMPFCDNCGFQIKDSDRFCPNCGKEVLGPAKTIGSTDSSSAPSPYSQPSNYSQAPNNSPPPMGYQPNYPQPNYQQGGYGQGYTLQGKRAVNAPYAYKIAPLGDRCVAYIIDSILTGVGLYFCCLPGLFYGLFKDSIRQGRAFGKGSVDLRVVNFNTGMPATPMESCIRNFCDICVCWLLVEPNQRHIGDLIAGTIVIKDE